MLLLKIELIGLHTTGRSHCVPGGDGERERERERERAERKRTRLVDGQTEVRDIKIAGQNKRIGKTIRHREKNSLSGLLSPSRYTCFCRLAGFEVDRSKRSNRSRAVLVSRIEELWVREERDSLRLRVSISYMA